jgi:hypothetical protein
MMNLLPRRTEEEILTPQVIDIIVKVCEDYNIPPEDVMCKTSMHEAVKVKRIIAYILFTFLKINRFDLALIMFVEPMTIWAYKDRIGLKTMHDPQLEEKYKQYTLL